MVKCWKLHRDVPTKISELVGRAVDDLHRRQLDLKQRMSKNIIKVEPLDKFTDLLSKPLDQVVDCCFLVENTMPRIRLKQKLKDIQQTQEKGRHYKRFLELRKKRNFQLANYHNFL
jgi:hypothetical protein